MGRRLSITPLQTLTLEIRNLDGEIEKEVDFTFNNYALTTLVNEFGDIMKLFNDYQEKPYDVCAIMLYAGVKANCPSFTLEEARIIVASGGSVVLEEISGIVIESLINIGGNDVRKKFVEEMKARKIMG